jgi:drug/metabolite transporter (DMT)-like permease
MRRRWLAIALVAVGAGFVVTGSVLSALHAHDATAAGVLFALAAIACIVGAVAAARGTGGKP